MHIFDREKERVREVKKKRERTRQSQVATRRAELLSLLVINDPTPSAPHTQHYVPARRGQGAGLDLTNQNAGGSNFTSVPFLFSFSRVGTVMEGG